MNHLHNAICLFLLSIPCACLANGGPVDISGVLRSGGIRFSEMPGIELTEERLSITLQGDYALVEVRYTLENRMYQGRMVRYAFPVDYDNAVVNGKDTSGWQDDYVPVFTILDGDRPLKIEAHSTDSTRRDSVPLYGADKVEMSYQRRWFTCTLQFEAHENKHLHVRYKVKSRYEDYALSKDFFVIYDERAVFYDLRPAARWGSGRVRRFRLDIDARSVTANSEDVEIHGVNVREEKPGFFTFKGYNVDLDSLGYVLIRYGNSVANISRDIPAYRIGPKNIRALRSSSVLEGSYDPENAFDGDVRTAWVEGAVGSGVGEWIEVDIRQYHPGAILILNGYYKNADIYRKNSRIKKLKLELEVEPWEGEENPPLEVREVELEDRPFQTVRPDNLYAALDRLVTFGDGFRTVKRIRLTILEVYPGTKYSDVCISELYILGFAESP